jgi:hypothetical protein
VQKTSKPHQQATTGTQANVSTSATQTEAARLIHRLTQTNHFERRLNGTKTMMQ